MINPHSLSALTATTNPDLQTRLRIRIPYHFQQEPIISTLITQHGVTVNIAAALLGVDMGTDGWFDLELRGKHDQITSAIVYLNDLDIEILNASNAYPYQVACGE